MQTETTYWVTASQPQHTPAGKLLHRMYYGNFLESSLTREQRSGYPHNGGEHTLSLKLSVDDLKAFLSLVLETFRGHEGALPFVDSIKARFAQAHPRLANAL